MKAAEGMAEWDGAMYCIVTALIAVLPRPILLYA